MSTPASADPVGLVEQDGVPVAASGPGLLASDVTFAHGILIVRNPSSNSNETITDIQGTLASAGGQVTDIENPFPAFFSCTWSGSPVQFDCPVPGIAGPGSDIELPFSFAQPYTQGFSKINVIFNFNVAPACGPGSSASISDSFFATDCNPPGATKLVSANINEHARTASFHFEANRAVNYKCKLFLDGRLRYSHNCGPVKSYLIALPKGAYTFAAWGVNRAGISRAPALKRFTIR